LDSTAPDGQAGSSKRIENYLGFPTGLTGAELTDRATLQANKFGAQLSNPTAATRLSFENGYATLDASGGEPVTAKCLLIATGAQYRRLDVEGVEQFEGTGLYYAASTAEALLCRGCPVIVVGGGNSAGQAAVFLAGHASRVLLLIRGTRAIQILQGLALLVVLRLIAQFFHLWTIFSILNGLLIASGVAIPVVFQPEIRRALAQLGRPELAVLHVEKAYRLSPPERVPEERWLGLARRYNDTGRAEDAERVLRNDALRRWPASAEGDSLPGRVLMGRDGSPAELLLVLGRAQHARHHSLLARVCIEHEELVVGGCLVQRPRIHVGPLGQQQWPGHCLQDCWDRRHPPAQPHSFRESRWYRSLAG